MIIERAKPEDMDGINSLLRQVLKVHHNGRPDLFRDNAKKYTDSELLSILQDDSRPVFVAKDEKNRVLGYAFCVLTGRQGDNILNDMNTLYIDDLCVDENARGQHIGKSLYEYVTEFAKAKDCYNVTLNVWSCNPGAIRFYEKCGLKPQKICMEKILNEN